VIDELVEAFYVTALTKPLLALFFHDSPLDQK
jgi:truncated hemoglobin YjbI